MPTRGLVVSAVLLLAFGTGAAGPGSDSTFQPDRGRRRIESIEVSAPGDAGVIRTVPDVLGEPAGTFHFGAPRCKGRSLAAATLEQLHIALRTRQLVTIDARTTGEGGAAVACVETVTFWAPETGTR